MKASELIEALQEIVKERGDLPVYYYDDGREYEVEAPEYCEAQDPRSWNRHPLPERIEL